jgi:flagellar biosynthesis chaperone FliJ
MAEEIVTTTVAEMLRVTGNNTNDFMQQVAEHIEKLEDAVKQLQARVQELEEGVK